MPISPEALRVITRLDTFEKAEAFYDSMPRVFPNQSDLEQAIRDLDLYDLYFLLTRTLMRPGGGAENLGRDARRPWIFERCREVQAAPDGYLDLWSREHYKDLDCDTPTLTSAGWVRHGDLVPGDEVYTPTGETARVVAVQHFTDSACRNVSFRGGASLVAGAGHLWGVLRWSSKRVKGNVRVGWVPEVHETDALLTLGKRPKIPLPAPLHGHKNPLRVDPYVLGMWLGDGDSSGGRICGQDPEIFEEVQRRGYRLSPTHCPQRAPFRTSTVYGLVHGLRELGVLGNKHIPASYMGTSAQDRLALLQGLMDTDGHQATGRNSHATFANTNKRLAEDVLSLACSLGFKARLSPSRTTRSWHVCFQTSTHDAFSPFLLPRKSVARSDRARNDASAHWYVQAVEPTTTRPTNCIQIDDPRGVYLAGRHLIPTHNSSIISFALPIQEVLNDSELTNVFFSFNRPMAKGFLRQIKTELERNAALKALHPDVLWADPRREAPKWSEDEGLIVRRKGNPKECTFEAFGVVDGQPTSRHYLRRIYDDLVTFESVRTPEMSLKVTQSWEASLNLAAEGGIERYAGTRWHHNDTYKAILDRGTSPRVRLATHDGTLTGDLALWDRPTLINKRRTMGEFTFACQIMQDPRAGTVGGFKEAWLKFYDQSKFERGQAWGEWNRVIIVDPASGKKKENDYTVLTVWGLGADLNWYLIHGERGRFSLSERTDRVFRLHARFAPQIVGYEEYGMQADVEHIEMEMERRNYRFQIVKLGGNIPKSDRIRRLQPMWEAGRIYLPRVCPFQDHEGRALDFVKEFLDEEYRDWPVSGHDDMLDCMARMQDPKLPISFPRSEEFSMPVTADTAYDLNLGG